MLKGVLKAIKDNNMIKRGDKIVAGISGGADSVAMLLQLAEYREQTDYTLQVFHLNHMIREDASHDEEFVRELCSRLNIPFYSEQIDVTALSARLHLSLEEAGRKARYEAMRDLGPDKIAVGHHKDDLAETVILNMCRGTGLHGMVGIAPVQDDIIRPLIYTSRSEIEEYLADIGQDYCTDSTNAQTDYTRNKIRHDILPLLTKSVNDKATEHITHMAEDMLKLEQYIMTRVDEAYVKYVQLNASDGTIHLKLKAMNELDKYIANELILRVLEKLTPRRKDITRSHVEGIIGLHSLPGEKTMDIPYGIKVIKTYDELIFIKNPEDSEIKPLNIKIPALTEGEGWSTVLDDGTDVTIRVKSYRNKPEIPNKAYTKWFDYDKIDCSELYLRYRASGDYLTINSKGDKKSIQDYMVDEKIERYRRDTIPLLAQGDHVLWVIGHRISEHYKLSEESKKIFEVDITQGEKKWQNM
ncbi:MAG: tRNA lysidine(34) synthetase TilS [Lachnospiraceae bacterium]|nr:tRNA lysidine(34) synthetase TilS [Lachnospiraceae bacterium]